MGRTVPRPKKGTNWLRELGKDIPSFELPQSKAREVEGEQKVPKFELGETMKIDGHPHCWFVGFADEKGNLKVVIAGHEDEGLITVAPDCVRYCSDKEQVAPPTWIRNMNISE